MKKCCDYTASMLRQMVAIQRLNKTADGAGGWEKSWSSIGTAHAYMRASGGGERFFADRLNMEIRYVAVIRYRENIQASDRIIYDGKAYQIRSIVDVEFKKKWLELSLEEGVAN
jgi:SPP1 family predicted phage head-tail adaptor